jgi:hypothetical protein
MENSVSDFRVDQRVQLHPATDLWMRGARYGTVRKVGRKLVHVHVDALNRVLRFDPRNLLTTD